MKKDDAIESLVELGLTPLEGEAYMALLLESPATGYRVAQTLNRPAANVYKALESLEKKGAIIAETGKSRRLRAVPPTEFLAQLQRKFVARRSRAEQALAHLPGFPDDDRVYSLTNCSQVFERARAMLARCSHVLLVDTVNRPLEMLRTEIEAVAARKVEVAVRTDKQVALAGVELVSRLPPEVDFGSWPGDWLCLVVDGREHLLAFLSQEDDVVYQAIWSGSAYLSFVYHCGVCCEIILEILLHKMRESRTVENLSDLVTNRFRRWISGAPGRDLLMNRFDMMGIDWPTLAVKPEGAVDRAISDILSGCPMDEGE